MATSKKSAPAKKAASKSKSAAPPWDKENPKGDHHQHLDAKTKAAAKRSAAKAGRPYPNLVDNMNAAKKAKK